MRAKEFVAHSAEMFGGSLIVAIMLGGMVAVSAFLPLRLHPMFFTLSLLAMLFALATLGYALWLAAGFDPAGPAIQLHESRPWNVRLGSYFALGIDGIALAMVLLSTLLSTVFGTMMALALVRGRFRGRGLVDLLVLLPMATPEVVLGASLLTLFVQGFSKVGLQLGFWALVMAHTMFCLSFVVVAVRARLQTLDPRLEEAAADLYATPMQGFWLVTLPNLLPGVAAGALLSFALSFDDVIISTFVSGEVATFPTYVYTAYLRGIPAEANVIGVAMFLLAIAAVALAGLLGWGRTRRGAAEPGGARERG